MPTWKKSNKLSFYLISRICLTYKFIIPYLKNKKKNWNVGQNPLESYKPIVKSMQYFLKKTCQSTLDFLKNKILK